MNDVLFLGRMTGCDLIFSGLPRFPVLGQETFCKAFDIKIGGSANSPIAAAKLGLKVGFITEVGDDFLGDFLINELRKTGIDLQFVYQVDGMKSCVSAVLSTEEERGFATYVEEPQQFTVENIKKAMPYAKYVYTDLEHCVLSPIAELAEEAGVKLVLDCSWNETLRLDDVKEILKKTSAFTANELEARMLTGEADPYKALLAFSEYAETAVIKRGEKGCIACQNGRIYKIEGVTGIKVLDTTGAGDAFSAGLLYGILNGMDLEKSLQIANSSGALAVTYYGGGDISFTRENVFDLWERNYGSHR